MTEVDEKDVLDGAALEGLYKWIDAVPLTRPKKNIARDFSDGVLVAEIIHHYLPRAVEVHNYVAANSIGQKRINWNTLNRKVFSKLNIKLSDVTLNQVIESKPGAIEQILWDLRQRILEHSGLNTKLEALMTINSKNDMPGFVSMNLDKKPPSSRSSRTLLTAKPTQNKQPIKGPTIGNTRPTFSKNNAKGKLGGSTESSSVALGYSKNQPKQAFGQRSQGNMDGFKNDELRDRPGDSSNSNESGQAIPPSQIIFRGHKMVAVELLESKEKEMKEMENTKKQLSVKIDRLEKLIGIKDQRIEDLTHSVHNLRTMYERVTQTTWDESTAEKTET